MVLMNFKGTDRFYGACGAKSAPRGQMSLSPLWTLKEQIVSYITYGACGAKSALVRSTILILVPSLIA